MCENECPTREDKMVYEHHGPSKTNILTPVLNVSFIVGALGNVAALWILYKSRKVRNKKHLLLLRCLALNDLVAQLGMLVMLQIDRFKAIPSYYVCVGYVLLRAFGLGSGCVAFVMALERWLALTRPFLYHQYVTYQSLKRFICCLWLSAIVLTYLPFFGFGLFYNKDTAKCVKFRYAKELADIIYAYLFFTFGSILCLFIAWCNTMVVWELLRIRSEDRILVRRISRSTITRRVGSNKQTPEEVAFAKLMAIVCVVFILCWAPQVISVPIAQYNPNSKFCEIYSKLADFLLCIYFTLDPFIYVLQRYIEKGKCFSPIFWCKKDRHRQIDAHPETPTGATTLGTPTSVLLQPPNFTFANNV